MGLINIQRYSLDELFCSRQRWVAGKEIGAVRFNKDVREG